MIMGHNSQQIHKSSLIIVMQQTAVIPISPYQNYKGLIEIK